MRIVSIALLGSATVASGERVSGSPLETFVTARQAHDLSLEEARRGHPVHLRAVVTYYDPFVNAKRPGIFVHDVTGGVFVGVSSEPHFEIHSGSYIDITGVTAAGDYGPIVGAARVRLIGAAPLPLAAPKVSMSELLDGRFDGQWVEVEGVVHSVDMVGKNVALHIAMVDGIIRATTIREPGADYSRLIDSYVRLHADVGPLYNRKLQLTGVHLLFPGLAVLSVVEPGVPDPFALPVLPIESLLGYTAEAGVRHRVHVRGPVTARLPGRSLCIQNGSEGLCLQTRQTQPVAEGEVVDVVGFPAVGGVTPTFTDASYRSTGTRQSVNATPVTAKQALNGDYDAELVQIEGKVIGVDRGANEPTVVLSSGKFIFPVVLASPWSSRDLPEWQEGSTVRVTGVCSVQAEIAGAIGNGFPIPVSFRILLRSGKDLVIVHKASWWTAVHLLPILALLLVATLCVLSWVVTLRHRITVQTRLIQRQNVTLEGLSFQDQLTGVANRRKFDHVIQLELDKAIESGSSISLLMIDIDSFKVLNDTYGHQFGDECIARVAEALASASLRTSDLLARYGGDEFAVIMPCCDEQGAAVCVERLRMSVRGIPVTHLGSQLDRRLSVSIGSASIVPRRGTTAASLIALADRSLYEFKQARSATARELRLSGAIPLTNS